MQSDFGRLFHNRPTPLKSPIENFSSEALAIAIDHDDRPIRRALARIDWPVPGRPPFDAASVRGVTCRTQSYLKPAVDREGPIREGYLDLVLETTTEGSPTSLVWVETKVESELSRDQLQIYARHARVAGVSSIVLLSKSRLADFVGDPPFPIGWLAWKEIAAAVASTPGPDPRWLDLLQFLGEQWIAWPPVSAELTDRTPQVDVLVLVNERLQELWPNGLLAWVGRDPVALRKSAEAEYQRSGRLVTTGGPLTYGLVHGAGGWQWSLAVGNATFRGIPLQASVVAAQADAAGLGARWVRSKAPHAMLEVRTPLEAPLVREDVATWFSEALGDVNKANVLEPYLMEIAARATK